MKIIALIILSLTSLAIFYLFIQNIVEEIKNRAEYIGWKKGYNEHKKLADKHRDELKVMYDKHVKEIQEASLSDFNNMKDAYMEDLKRFKDYYGQTNKVLLTKNKKDIN